MRERAARPLLVATVTTFFPNAVEPQRAVFVHNLVRALQQHCAVEVVAPVPYAPPFVQKPQWRRWRAVPAHENTGGIAVQHPRVFVLPGVPWLSGLGYCLGVYTSVWKIARAARMTHRVVVHAHCAYPDAVGVALACRLLRLPCVVTAHGSDINVYAKQARLRGQIRWALQGAAGVIAVSEALAVDIAMLTGSTPACIPCAAVDPTVFQPADRGTASASLSLPPHARVILFVGQLVKVKGIDTLIAACGLLLQQRLLTANDRLVLIGDGPLRAGLTAQAAALGLSFHFVGATAQPEVARWMQAATLLCLPSHHEGTPNVIVEALASGLPVVASRVGGIPALVQEGVNGNLVAPGDAPALAAVLAAAMLRPWDRETVAATVADRTWTAIAAKNLAYLDDKASSFMATESC